MIHHQPRGKIIIAFIGIRSVRGRTEQDDPQGMDRGDKAICDLQDILTHELIPRIFSRDSMPIIVKHLLSVF